AVWLIEVAEVVLVKEHAVRIGRSLVEALALEHVEGGVVTGAVGRQQEPARPRGRAQVRYLDPRRFRAFLLLRTFRCPSPGRQTLSRESRRRVRGGRPRLGGGGRSLLGQQGLLEVGGSGQDSGAVLRPGRMGSLQTKTGQETAGSQSFGPRGHCVH